MVVFDLLLTDLAVLWSVVWSVGADLGGGGEWVAAVYGGGGRGRSNGRVLTSDLDWEPCATACGGLVGS